MSDAQSGTNGILQMIADLQDVEGYKVQNWEGSFSDYLSIVREDPNIARNAYQRMYDMIMHFGYSEQTEFKKRVVRYHFFDDPIDDGKDAVFGIDVHLMKLVNVFKSAAMGYGTEKRVILLHGPVGSAKSTIVRMLKKGLEWYSRQTEGRLYTFSWEMSDGEIVSSPLNEDPLKLIPIEMREQVLEQINANRRGRYPIRIEGDLDPVSRFLYKQTMREVGGDWLQLIERIRVRRLILSERDRVGIGTFQPKDEKNQDSTELTGDINYRKIAEYGSDSDPRAFNFDGEFCVANRGVIEFVEVLKLDVAFLYDLLGASQEHVIKPKKFAQTAIDEVIIGHSVAGDTPIPFRLWGVPGWTTLEGLHERFGESTTGLEVLAYDFELGQTRWTAVKSVFRHRFAGCWVTTSQKWGAVETTPNHSIYDRDGQVFYPEDGHEIMTVRRLAQPFAGSDCGPLVDALDGVPGFVRHDTRKVSGGGPMLKPARVGWGRLALPRHATQVRAVYDIRQDIEALKDLVTVLAWYATEGHVNGADGGVVITRADSGELERVRSAYQRVTTARGSIDVGAETDSAWRLYLEAEAVRVLATHHCGEHAVNKRLPDFLFRCPREVLAHAFDELMRADGSRKLSGSAEATAGAEYRENHFEYKTISPLLAAQVGTLATMLGYDYSVYRHQRDDKPPAYRIRFASAEGVPGGRHKRFEARLYGRQAAFGEWAYDIECEGLHNFVCGVGNVVCHNTNEPEYRKLQSNEFMEALRDRTIKIDVPYITKWHEEARIYAKDFNERRVINKHIAPHTMEMAAMWAVLTRLEEPKKHNLTLVQKLKLYDGKTLPGYTEDNVKELRKSARREGLEGISPRYVQDKISNALVRDPEAHAINPFMVLNELEGGLANHSLISDEDVKKRYRDLLGLVKREYEDVVKNEVQKAITADENAIARLCANYIDNVKAYTQKEKVRNPYTGAYEEPDERLMRSIEEKIDIADTRKDDFRREIMNYIGALSLDGKTFEYYTNERLHKALELKLFEDQKDSIKLTSLVTQVVDKETQAKIDIVKQRLIDRFGYDEQSATDVLNYVASIFARGDAS